MKKSTKRILALLTAVLIAFSFWGCKSKKQTPPVTVPLPEVPIEKPVDPVDPPDTSKTYTVSGAEDITVKAGRAFNVFDGVETVCNETKESVTESISTEGYIDYGKTGEYEIKYKIEDKVVKTRKVTVSDNPAILADKGKTTALYTKRDNSNYNIALGTSAFASSYNGGDIASKVVDGSVSTRWDSIHGDGNAHYITVDLGSVLSFDSIIIQWEAAYAKDIEILVSDNNKTYTKIKEINGYNYSNQGTQTIDTIGASARYVRVNCLVRGTNYDFSIYEISIFGKSGINPPVEDYPVLAELENSITDNAVLTLDMGADTGKFAFAKVWISGYDWRGAGDYQLKIELSNDKVSWAKYSEGKKSNHLLVDASDKQSLLSAYGENNDPASDLNVRARYVRFTFSSRPMTATAYQIAMVNFQYCYERTVPSDGVGYIYKYGRREAGGSISNDANLILTGVTAEASKGVNPSYAINGDTSNYWSSNPGASADIIVDLADCLTAPAQMPLEAGEIVLTWELQGGKYYDLFTSIDGVSYTHAFRQHHGGDMVQTINLYKSLRYIKIIDYSNYNKTRYQLKGIKVKSQFPGVYATDYSEQIQKDFMQQYTVEMGDGSYTGGMTDFQSARLITYLDESLRDKPVPSNDWWQSLLINNLGHSMYVNPLRAKFTTAGLEVGYPGVGYLDGLSQKVSNYNDLTVTASNISADSALAIVTGYSDYGIDAVFTDNKELDKMKVWLNQGSPYVYFSFLDSETPVIKLNDIVRIFDVNGTDILEQDDAAYLGANIGITVRTLAIEKRADTYQKIYEYRTYAVSAPENTVFTRNGNNIELSMSGGNYLSVGALGSTSEISGAVDIAEFTALCGSGYAFATSTLCTYEVGGDNIVTTNFKYKVEVKKAGAYNEPIIALMPHQWSKSKNVNTSIIYKGVHGDFKAVKGSIFTTEDMFYGIVPQFTQPDNDEFSKEQLRTYLNEVYQSEVNKDKDKLMSGDPYWQGKNLHPLSMSVIAADQIGDIELRDKFVECIAYILGDWYTYSGSGDEYYFYFDDEWKSLYYKNSEFGANFNMADHHFTYGYYLLASAVTAMYDSAFLAKYKDMIELLIRDYMCYDRNDELMPYMRAFDPYAGHAWAGGYADNDGGNNQESAGEALNAWVGAYLYGQVIGDKELVDAAVYGYTTEMTVTKEYWFDYNNRNFLDEYKEKFSAAGQIYGGTNFYGTFFNGMPLYIYGIHWIPGGEFLSHFAIGEKEQEIIGELYAAAKREHELYTGETEWSGWAHIMYPILAMSDPDAALAAIAKTEEDIADVEGMKPAILGKGSIENVNAYWLVNGFKSFNNKTDEIYAKDCDSAVVYKRANGEYVGMAWNPTDSSKTYTFCYKDGSIAGKATVPAKSFYEVNPEIVNTYGAYFTGSVDISGYDTLEGSFGGDYKATYRIVLPREGVYYISAQYSGTLKASINGNDITSIDSSFRFFNGKYILTVEGSGQLSSLTLIKKPELTNIALNKTAKSNAEALKNINDGNMSTIQRIGNSGSASFIIDLGEVYDIELIKIHFGESRVASYTILGALEDNAFLYEKLYEAKNVSGTMTDSLTVFNFRKVRYLQLYCTPSPALSLNIAEFEVYVTI